MDFLSTEVQECVALFNHSKYGDARHAVMRLLTNDITSLARLEALSLLYRINIERDEVHEMEQLHASAVDLLGPAREAHSCAALYHLGIVCLLCEDPENAEICFRASLAEARNQEQSVLSRYGIAAVLHNRKQSEQAQALLEELPAQGIRSDTSCLVQLLKGNCMRAQGQWEPAHAAYRNAQSQLTKVRTLYLHNWVFFSLAIVHARHGEVAAARALFDVVLSLTHPTDFRRLHKLASDELARLETKAEVFFDPHTGDIVSRRGYLCLRRKPTLIAILTTLMESWPGTIDKETLYRRVWPGEYHPLRHDGLIYSHIQRLRQILRSDMNLSDFIQTEPEGYRLNPKITVKFRDETSENTPRPFFEEPHHEH